MLLIGLDGCRPDLLREHAGPNLRRLIERGAVSWDARAVVPSVTHVNWGSMLTGRVPAAHGIDRRDVREEELANSKVAVPTVFELLEREGLDSAAFFGHWKLYHPLERGGPLVHFTRSPYEARAVAPLAAEHLRTHKPSFCFVWMGDLDGIGHAHGWMSDQQIAALAEVDAAIGTLVDALHAAGTIDKTLILITADHGGAGRSHGQGRPEDVMIPWIAAGPGVNAGSHVTGSISTVDTAATVLWALGVATNEPLDGRPVTEAFDQRE